jgi:16S rRNA (guanine966-N2)-methyltransferase
MQNSSKARTGHRPVKQQAHQVRIIGGQWKRTPLPVLSVEGLRPTTDRVRETVFNWLNHLIDGQWSNRRCLDLFAGSGALGFEAASRGAQEVVFMESHAAVIRHLAAAKDKLSAQQVRIVPGDVLMSLRKMGSVGASAAQYNMIFVDPPYHQGWLDKIMPLCAQILTEDGLLYVEAEMSLTADELPTWMSEWEVLRADKAGMVFYHVLQRKNIPEMGHNAHSVD